MCIANKFTLCFSGQTNRHCDGEMKCFPSEAVLYKHRQRLCSVGNQVLSLSDVFTPIGTLRVYSHLISDSPFFSTFKNEFNAFLWCCLHITWKRWKMPPTKALNLMVRVNRPSATSFRFTLPELFSHFSNATGGGEGEQNPLILGR